MKQSKKEDEVVAESITNDFANLTTVPEDEEFIEKKPPMLKKNAANQPKQSEDNIVQPTMFVSANSLVKKRSSSSLSSIDHTSLPLAVKKTMQEQHIELSQQSNMNVYKKRKISTVQNNILQQSQH